MKYLKIIILILLILCLTFVTLGSFQEGMKEKKEKKDDTKNYNENNYDIEYHDPVEVIAKTSTKFGTNFNEITVYDKKLKKLIVMPFTKQQGTAVYFDPGSFKYGSENYVPTYTESVLLSRSNNIKK